MWSIRCFQCAQDRTSSQSQANEHIQTLEFPFPPACLTSVGGNQSTHREPTQKQHLQHMPYVYELFWWCDEATSLSLTYCFVISCYPIRQIKQLFTILLSKLWCGLWCHLKPLTLHAQNCVHTSQADITQNTPLWGRHMAQVESTPMQSQITLRLYWSLMKRKLILIVGPVKIWLTELWHHV